MAILNLSKKIKISLKTLLLASLFPVAGYSATMDQIKVAFIYNFSHYVNWPDSSFQSSQDPFTICLNADKNLLTLMELTVKDERVNDRSFKVIATSNVRTSSNCQIFFISSSRYHRPPAIQKNPAAPTLFVSDYLNFSAKGGMIEIQEQDQHLKLLVNLKSVKKAGLSIRSNLLNIVTIVE